MQCCSEVPRQSSGRLTSTALESGSPVVRVRPVIVLVLALVGALPTWGHSRSWGYGPTGGLGLVLLIVLILRESPSYLLAKGKPEHGTITLCATSGRLRRSWPCPPRNPRPSTSCPLRISILPVAVFMAAMA